MASSNWRFECPYLLLQYESYCNRLIYRSTAGHFTNWNLKSSPHPVFFHPLKSKSFVWDPLRLSTNCKLWPPSRFSLRTFQGSFAICTIQASYFSVSWLTAFSITLRISGMLIGQSRIGFGGLRNSNKLPRSVSIRLDTSSRISFINSGPSNVFS